MKIDASTVEKYQLMLEKDPNSQVFAPLAEAYREMGMLSEALKVVTAGVQRHPQFVGGLVTYARILRDTGELDQALGALKKATSMSAENLLAHQLLAEIHLAKKNPKEALKSFKMVLFLNPQSKTAQKAVQKLESLTADEYDEEVFAMTKLPQVDFSARTGEAAAHEPAGTAAASAVTPATGSPNNRALERMLSLIDAFIVRNDLEKAHALLKDTKIEFGDSPEIQRRLKSLQIRYNDSDEPTPLKPINSRQQQVREKQLEALQLMLRKIEEYRAKVDQGYSPKTI